MIRDRPFCQVYRHPVRGRGRRTLPSPQAKRLSFHTISTKVAADIVNRYAAIDKRYGSHSRQLRMARHAAPSRFFLRRAFFWPTKNWRWRCHATGKAQVGAPPAAWRNTAKSQGWETEAKTTCERAMEREDPNPVFKLAGAHGSIVVDVSKTEAFGINLEFIKGNPTLERAGDHFRIAIITN